MAQTPGYHEPTEICPNCGHVTHAEWVDIGFGPYSQQAGPFHCAVCDWVEAGCPSKSDCKKCTAYSYCQGRSLSDSTVVSLVRSFLTILNIEEESDSGRVFKPNRISSCRVHDTLRLETILKNLEKEIGYKKE